MSKKNPPSEFILYQTEDGASRIQVRLENETVWLTQRQLADLYQLNVNTVSRHIKVIFDDGELKPEATVRQYRIVAPEAAREVERLVNHYNLDMVLAIGYRVRSARGTQFRRWATERLSEYLVKGFVLDDERLKEGRNLGADYFDELLERIRDIRASERRFYQKVLDIYATSVDYTPDAEASQQFFATVQNKMHWATHGHTAAELIHQRADASKPNMGLMSTRPGGIVRKDDVAVAKNYLTEEELQVLNRIVNLYIEFAELQALERKPMTMRDWMTKLDEFLKISGRELLNHAGKISAETARVKAEKEYVRYRSQQDALPRPVDVHFEQAAKQIQDAAKRLPKRKPARKKGDA